MPVTGQTVDVPFEAFANRTEAGRALADFIVSDAVPGMRIVALPRGGVAVGGPVARNYHAPLGLAPIRKLPIPYNPEAGFGAVAIDGTVVLNDEMVESLRLEKSEIKTIAKKVLTEVQRRARSYLGSDEFPSIEGRDVFVVDDGLATGYTALAAAGLLRKQKPRKLVLAVPAAPFGSIETVSPSFDEVYCLVAQERPPFAVASYYADFHEMADHEVIEILQDNAEYVCK